MRKHKNFWNGKLSRFIELFIDIAILFFMFLLSSKIDHYITYGAYPSFDTLFSIYRDVFYILIIYLGIMVVFFLTYQVSVISRQYINVMTSQFLALFLGNALFFLVLLIGKGFHKDLYFSQLFAPLILLALQVFAMSLFKLFLSKIMNKLNQRIVLIYGPKANVLQLFKEFLIDKHHYKIIRYVVFYNEEDPLPNSLKECISNVDDIYITDGLSSEAKNMLVTYILQKTYKGLYLVPKTYEIEMQRSEFDVVNDTLVFKQKTMHLSPESRFFKRIFDLFFTTIILLIACIPMLIVAIIIKLQDGGPIIYKQVRLGIHNKPFMMYKFRSMKVDSDEKTLATKDDDRITKFGKIIRASRIDELPQFLNVLKGNMSIVGPRPLLPNIIEEATKKDPEFSFRANVKPGITGLSHIYGSYDTPDLERLRYDLMYVRNYSLLLDISIILLTIRVMLSKTAGLGKYENRSLEEILEIKNIKVLNSEYILNVTYNKEPKKRNKKDEINSFN
ncbi:exopolysaccharide biosynthesis polyprenyl glycosylphosphotransferase [Acholeplasma sp. OttesenSCG-928-E16]|nr:exopolysaccharide biosynthesis polyprenyl glycosylphosphotransferase [Acholeplasma sp. OttesenSCG-928-E16]